MLAMLADLNPSYSDPATFSVSKLHVLNDSESMLMLIVSFYCQKKNLNKNIVKFHFESAIFFLCFYTAN